MATVGWIKIGTAVNTAGLNKGAHAVVSSLEGLKNSLLGIAAAAAVGLGVREITEWVKRTAEAVGETRILAERVGFSAESFGRLSYAAKMAHLDGEGLTKSIEKMNERLAEVAITGEGPAAEALKRFGISARMLVALGPEQAFSRLLTVLERIPSPMERNKVAMDLFGKSGQAMINMAARGSSGLSSLGDEASALGVALNQVDVERVAEVDSAFIRVGAAIEGVGNTVTVALAPYITALTDQFITWMKSGTKSSSYVSQSLGWVVDAVGLVADAVQVLETGFHGLRAVFTESIAIIVEGIDKAIQAFGWLYEQLTGNKAAISDFAKNLAEALHAAALGEMDKAEAAGNKKWNHKQVREFVDNLQNAALDRALFKADKAAAFAGGQTTTKAVEPGLAGAFQFGSKEAYSSAVQSRARMTTTIQNRIESNTRMTAEATARSAAALGRMVQIADDRARNGAQGLQMQAGH